MTPPQYFPAVRTLKGLLPETGRRPLKDAILFNGLVSAWGDVNEQARKFASTPRSSQQEFDFDEDED